MNNNGFAPQSAGISPALLNSFQNPHQQQQKPFPGTLNPDHLPHKVHRKFQDQEPILLIAHQRFLDLVSQY